MNFRSPQAQMHHEVSSCIIEKRPVTWITYSNGDKTQQYLQSSSRHTGQKEARLVMRAERK